MKWLRSFGHFWYDFIVGDDWRIALGVVIVLALTDVAAHNGVDIWWLMPLGVVILAGWSLRRATRPPT